MASNNNVPQIIHDLTPLIRVYSDGRVERLELAPPVPTSLDPQTGVTSKDVEVIPGRGVGVRIFKPNMVQCPGASKLPVVVYYHGGGFVVQSTYGALFYNYLNNLASQARVLIVSVEYRLAPEHPVPACYDDCWDALDWVVSHAKGPNLLDSSPNPPEPWLTDNADFSKIFLAGDSAGANIAHQVATRVGTQGLANGSIHHITGLILCHPFFWGKHRIGDEATKMLSRGINPNFVDDLWSVACPGTPGSDDPRINPTSDPNLKNVGTERVVVFVAQDDVLRDRGWAYKESLEKSGWCGEVKVVETQGEGHVFHLYNPSSANAVAMMKNVVDFIHARDRY